VVQVDAVKIARERRARKQPSVHRLVKRPKREVVGGAQQVNRAAHHVGAHGPALRDQVRELARLEIGQSGPEADVGGERGLRLEAGDVLDRVERGHRRAS
jgi:hypothetical protein